MTAQTRITPFLWFDHQAEEAATFYASLFAHAQIGEVTRYSPASAAASGLPEGSVMTVPFQLEGLAFVALNGGPLFTFTPAVSFFVNCDDEAEIDTLWHQLSAGGTPLMPLDHYPFSEKFGWLNDRFGLSWQLNLAPSATKIAPYLLFVGDQHGKAEEAITLYTSLLPNSHVEHIERVVPGEGDTTGTVRHATFSLHGQQFMAMDGGLDHAFTFSEANSFLVNCQTQAEVDRLWDTLTTGGEAGPCGWLKDKFGVSWQIVPTALDEMLADPDPEKAERVTQAMLQMSRIEIAGLQQAYEG